MTRIRCLWANTDAVGCSWQNLRIQGRLVAETSAERVEIAETLKALIRKKANRPRGNRHIKIDSGTRYVEV